MAGRYRRDMHRVRDAIEASVDRHVASATVTLPGVLSGPDLARLLDALCSALNQGLMADVPSMWALFAKQQIAAALKASVRLFTKHHARQGFAADVPMTERELADTLDGIRAAAARAFAEVVVGLQPAAVAAGEEQLAARLQEEYAHAHADGIHDIKEFAKDRSRALVKKGKGEIKDILLPTATNAISST